MSALIEDMCLSDFLQTCSAKNVGEDVWTVTTLLKDLTRATFTIENCKSEYQAKEETFFYLMSKISKN